MDTSSSWLRKLALAVVGASVACMPPPDLPGPPDPMPPFPDAVIPSQEVGFLRGELGVTHDGAATYTLPIAVPPGRAGMQPSLALSYNHRGGDGKLGFGWSIAGTDSVISRCTRTHHPSGLADGIDFASTDGLCLDGQRLQVVKGSYGAPGSEYRTRLNGYARIVLNGDTSDPSASFTVTERNGEVYTYGGTTSSILRGERTVHDPTSASDGTVTYAWLLRRVEDTAGNYMELDYEQAVTNGEDEQPAIEANVRFIRYTGHTDLEPTRSVELIYVDRPDPDFSFVNGLRLGRTKILSRLETHAPGAPSTVSSYRFRHEVNPLTDRSLLKEVTLCDGFDRCLPSLAFDYVLEGEFAVSFTTIGTDFQRPEEWTSSDVSYTLVPADANGDGADDLVYWRRLGSADATWFLRTSSGTGLDPERASGLPRSSFFAFRPIPFDFDLDGSAEMLHFDAPALSVNLYEWDGSAYRVDEVDVARCRDSAEYMVGDLDGNGVSDMIFGCPGTPPSWTTRLHDGRLYGSYSEPSPLDHDGNPILFNTVVDYDGDGRYEVLAPDDDTGNLERILFDDALAPTRAPTGVPNDEPALFLDVNGDGLQDRVLIGGPSRLQVRFNSGAGFTPPRDALVGTSPVSNTRYESRTPGDARVLDWNRDGRDDLVLLFEAAEGDRARRVIHISNGEAFRAHDAGQPGVPNIGPADRLWPETVTLDFNGDGATDITRVDPEADPIRGEKNLIKIDTSIQVVPDVLEFVFEPGGEHFVQYAGLEDPSTHGETTGCQYPQRCIRGGMTVVRETRDPLDRRRRYTYFGARADVTGFGWLGFIRREVLELDSGILHRYLYDLDTQLEASEDDPGGDWPLARLPARTELHVPLEDGNLWARVTDDGYGARRITSGLPESSAHAVVELGTRQVSDYLVEEGFVGQSFEDVEPYRRSTTGYLYDSFGFGINVATQTLIEPSGGRFSTTVEPVIRPDRWLIGQPASVTMRDDVDGRVETRTTEFEYDARGLLEFERIERARPEYFVQHHYQRDGFGLVRRKTTTNADESLRRETAIDYDSESVYPRQVTQVLRPPDGEPAYEITETVEMHPGLGLVVVATDANGVWTRFQYDGFGRLRARADATGARADISYEPTRPAGGVVEVMTANDGTERSTSYDFFGRLTRQMVKALDGREINVIRSYDERNRLVSITNPVLRGDPVFDTRFEYDNLDRVVSAAPPGPGEPARASYGALSMSVTDRVKRTVEYAFDGRARVRSAVETDELGSALTSLTYDYGPFNVVRAVTDEDGLVYTFEHDAFGRRTRYVDPNIGTRRYEFDAFGQLSMETDARGLQTRYTRDDAGRITRVESDVDGVTQFTWDTAPNGLGLLAFATSPDATLAFSYDLLSRLTSERRSVRGRSLMTRYGYDTVGRLSRTVYPGGFSVEYGYAGCFGHLCEVRDATTRDPYWVAHELDAWLRVSSESFGNGVSTRRTFSRETGNLERIETSSPTTFPPVVLQDRQYEYRPDARVTLRDDHREGRSEVFGYDALGRLDSWEVERGGMTERVEDYEYDTFGNLRSTAGHALTYADTAHPHWLTSIGGAPVRHDADGQRIEDRGTTIEYTDSGQPEQVTGTAGSTSYGHDPFNRAAWRQAGAERTIYSGDLYERREGLGGAVEVFKIVAGNRLIAEVARGGGPLRTRYVHADGIGSIEVVTDERGFERDRAWYAPFGERLSPAGSPSVPSDSVVRRTFAGYEWQPSTGYLHAPGRAYDPDSGRFLTADPFIAQPADAQSLHRYAYVRNDPLSVIDPSGLQEVPPGGETGSGLDAPRGPSWDPADLLARPTPGIADSQRVDEPFFQRGGGAGPSPWPSPQLPRPVFIQPGSAGHVLIPNLPAQGGLDVSPLVLSAYRAANGTGFLDDLAGFLGRYLGITIGVQRTAGGGVIVRGVTDPAWREPGVEPGEEGRFSIWRERSLWLGALGGEADVISVRTQGERGIEHPLLELGAFVNEERTFQITTANRPVIGVLTYQGRADLRASEAFGLGFQLTHELHHALRGQLRSDEEEIVREINPLREVFGLPTRLGYSGQFEGNGRIYHWQPRASIR